jgi:nucleotide-binding universal stress UspA family protein
MLKTKKKSLQIKKILVPTDFSSYSDQAVDYAAMLAKAFKARIVLMHVPEPYPYTVTDTLNLVDYGRGLDKIAQSLLGNLRKKLTAKGFAVTTHLASGIAYREIVEKAELEKADMIVMGTHGRRGIDHLLLGSVAEKVVRFSGCPVVTVRSTSPSGKKK